MLVTQLVFIIHGFYRIILQTPLEAAQTQIYLSLTEGIEESSGKHFHDCHLENSYITAWGRTLAKEVWGNSEDFVKLTQAERKLPSNSNDFDE